ncbi:MAG TPA: hypothetical protein VLM80_02910, partial [Anaerolineales bacterium]|nr:hypothetical protein [Anaerolineales bacterium]
VPCCEGCNKYRLQPIETLLAEAVFEGPDAVRSLGNRVLFLWLGKIFYGILYKELFLSSDLKNRDAPPIIDPEEMRLYEDHLFFLQEARGKIATVNFCPGSIFVFRTQKPESNRLQWDFTDNIGTLFIGVRMGEVGVIGVLNDGGILQLHGDIYDSLANHPLHPLQFRELCAAISYQSSIRQRSPTHITIEGNPHQVIQPPVGGISLKPFYQDWDLDQFAQFLSCYTHFPIEQIHPHPNQIVSFLYDPDGKPIHRPIDNN